MSIRVVGPLLRFFFFSDVPVIEVAVKHHFLICRWEKLRSRATRKIFPAPVSGEGKICNRAPPTNFSPHRSPERGTAVKIKKTIPRTGLRRGERISHVDFREGKICNRAPPANFSPHRSPKRGKFGHARTMQNFPRRKTKRSSHRKADSKSKNPKPIPI